MTETGGLRERKKRRTRRAIHETALRLFGEQGYEETTIAEIAAAADVSPRTFFSYFATKEDVVFGDVEEAFEAYEQLLASRPPGESPFAILRGWIEKAWREHTLAPELEYVQARLICTVPAVRARNLQVFERFERSLVEDLASYLGLAPDDLDDPTPRMVAAAAVSAFRAVNDCMYEALVEAGEEDALRAVREIADDPLPRLETTLRFLEAGVEALRESS